MRRQEMQIFHRDPSRPPARGGPGALSRGGHRIGPGHGRPALLRFGEDLDTREPDDAEMVGWLERRDDYLLVKRTPA